MWLDSLNLEWDLTAGRKHRLIKKELGHFVQSFQMSLPLVSLPERSLPLISYASRKQETEVINLAVRTGESKQGRALSISLLLPFNEFSHSQCHPSPTSIVQFRGPWASAEVLLYCRRCSSWVALFPVGRLRIQSSWGIGCLFCNSSLVS